MRPRSSFRNYPDDSFGNIAGDFSHRASVVNPVGHDRFLNVRQAPRSQYANLTAALAGGDRSVFGIGAPGSGGARGMPAVASPAAVAQALARGRGNGPPTRTPANIVPLPAAPPLPVPSAPPSPFGPPPSTTPFTPGATTVISPGGGIGVQPLTPTEAGTAVLPGQRTDDPYLVAIGPKLQDLPEFKKRRLEGYR